MRIVYIDNDYDNNAFVGTEFPFAHELSGYGAIEDFLCRNNV